MCINTGLMSHKKRDVRGGGMLRVGSGCWPAEQGMRKNPVWQRGLRTDLLNPLQLLFLLIHTASQKFNPSVRREVDNCICLFF